MINNDNIIHPQVKGNLRSSLKTCQSNNNYTRYTYSSTTIAQQTPRRKKFVCCDLKEQRNSSTVALWYCRMTADTKGGDIVLPNMTVSVKDQNQFKTLLEMHASEMSGNEWHSIASGMDWSVDQVKTYAFWYLHNLTQDVRNDTRISADSKEKKSGSSSSQLDSYWSYEECTIFDNLLLRFPPQENEDIDFRWKQISTMLPKKNAKECKQRYENHFAMSAESVVGGMS